MSNINKFVTTLHYSPGAIVLQCQHSSWACRAEAMLCSLTNGSSDAPLAAIELLQPVEAAAHVAEADAVTVLPDVADPHVELADPSCLAVPAQMLQLRVASLHLRCPRTHEHAGGDATQTLESSRMSSASLLNR